jgi:tetratricopeptide (TPR) repeat protein
LILIWVVVLAAIAPRAPDQLASGLVFIAVLITPGYLLGDVLAWRLRLDVFERLALALPLGVAVLAVPGMIALLRHLTIEQLVLGWMIISAAVVVAWVLHLLRAMRLGPQPASGGERWTPDQLVLLAIVAIAFAALVPVFNLYKLDGDAYAVASFSADALAGLPLNAREPLFGTQLGPGVRMAFNQSLPLAYLWSRLSGIDPITLTATASRAMLALWALLAAYMLGKAARSGSRTFGLWTAAVSLLIYVAAPFLRGDNVALFYFERINADKFMVPVTMVPVAFALAIRYAEDGRRTVLALAAIVALAVSVIHPLIALMLAVGLGGFGAVHLLAGGHADTVRRRTLGVAALAALALALPLVQLLLSRGEAPLAASFSSSVEGWPLGQRQVAVLPHVDLPSLELYGPLPEVATLKAEDASGAHNPFLMWRFAVNMERRRLVFFDLNRYMADPSLLYEPPYLLALLLLALLLPGIRRQVGVQFAAGSTLAVLAILFNPLLMPLLGAMVMPWILWRFVWLLPYALIIALATERLVAALTGLTVRGRQVPAHRRRQAEGSLLATLLVAGGLALAPAIERNLGNLRERSAAGPAYFPVLHRIFALLQETTAVTGPVTVLADQELSVTLPAYVAEAHIVAHRMPTTSEVFPADRQGEALQRLIDQDRFFGSLYLTEASLEILRRYRVTHIIAASGSDLDTQLRLAPGWFAWWGDDQSYSLYAVRTMPTLTPAVRGNTALASHRWAEAARVFHGALSQDPGDLMAMSGLAEIAHITGQFDEALEWLTQASRQADLPNLHYRLGQLHAERGDYDASIAEFGQAQARAPQVALFHEALGDVCLTVGDPACASQQYRAAAQSQTLPGEDSRLMAEADLWRKRGFVDRAFPLYERAARLRPSTFNLLTLTEAYREAKQLDRAEQVLGRLRRAHALSAEVVAATADLAAARGDVPTAVQRYRQAIRLQELQAQESDATRLSLARVLLDAGRLDDAAAEIHRVLARRPHDAQAYALQGDLLSRRQQSAEASAAYRLAFELDPTRVDVYVSLRDQVRRHGGKPSELKDLLQTAIALNPQETHLWLDLGDQLQRLDGPRPAIDAYRRALKQLDASEASARLEARTAAQSRAFVYARLAGLHEDLGEPEPARSFYRAALAAAPEAPWAQVLWGDALRRQGEFGPAETAYRAALDLDGDDVAATVRLADLLFAQGRPAEATTYQRQAAELAMRELRTPGSATGGTGVGRLLAEVTTTADPQRSDEAAATTVTRSREPLAVEADDGAPRAVQLAVRSRAGYPLGEALTQAVRSGNRLEEAISLYHRQIAQGVATQVHPALLARQYKHLGDLYRAGQHWAEAGQAYQQAIRLDSWWPDTYLALAEIQEVQGDPAGSLQTARRAAEMAPGSVETRLAVAHALERMGQDVQALAVYRAAAQAHPGNAMAMLALGQALQARKRHADAVASYRRAMATNPGTPASYVGLAEIDIDQGEYAAARELLQQALQADSRDVLAYIRFGDLEQRSGHADSAREWYRRAAALSPAGHPSNASLVASLMRYGNYDLALAFLQAALAERPHDATLRLGLSQLYRVTGRLDDAWSALVSVDPHDPQAGERYAQMGAVSMVEGKPAAALESYRQAIALRPEEASSYLAASQVLVNQGRIDEALALLYGGRAAVREPGDLLLAIHRLKMSQGQPAEALAALRSGLDGAERSPQLLLALADHYAVQGNDSQAQALHQQAIVQYPHVAEVMVAQANAARQDEAQTDAAIRHYEEALILEPTAAGVYHSLASTHASLGRTDEARQVYERGLKMAPMASELIGSYAGFLINQGEVDQAVSLVDQALEKAPTAANLLARAEVYIGLRRWEDAVADLQAAREQEPGNVDVLLALGDLRTRQWSWSEAEQAFNQAVALAPGSPAGYLRLSNLAAAKGDEEATTRHAQQAQEVGKHGLTATTDTAP